MTLADLTMLMFRASVAEVGVLLRVSDPERAKRAFARAKEESLERGEDLPPLRFRVVSHPEGNLMILRTEGTPRG